VLLPFIYMRMPKFYTSTVSRRCGIGGRWPVERRQKARRPLCASAQSHHATWRPPPFEPFCLSTPGVAGWEQLRTVRYVISKHTVSLCTASNCPFAIQRDRR